MRIQKVSIVLTLVAVLSGAAIFFSKRHTSSRRSACDFVGAKTVFLNDSYLNSLMSKTARAILLPEAEAKCLPSSFKGTVEFFHFRAPLFVPFYYNHRLDLTLQKDGELGSLNSFVKDPENLQLLGYKDARDIAADLRHIYGPEVEKEKFAWVGVSVNEINWSRDVYGVPLIHPLAAVIDKSQLQKLLTDMQNQVIDLREASEIESSIPRSIRYKDLPSNSHLYPEEPKDLNIYQPLTKLIARERSVILYTNNETDYAAYNTATALRTLGYKKIFIYRGGLDDWNNKKIVVPMEAPVRVVNASDLLEISKNRKLLFIDVRSTEAFEFYRIQDSKRVTVGDYINNKAILSLFNVFPGTTLVLVGQDEYDWRSYKALMSILKSKPSLAKNILWYRQGISDAEFFNNRRWGLPESERLAMVGTKNPSLNKKRQRHINVNRKPRKVGDFEGQED